ncbi:hypothetical protein PQC38_gp006 [Aeromonas phage BUCT695]|uniref:hypothetical protein n=1 Tax=Aeromonas phage BUCT695 TaxID=2908630 RepID=UPI0023294320|nr:hypothetical protein PQC38_gp006 [Aeromonas phage BUCT695]UIW10482.1 hypothetical protein [Aeromonas phage BUCT695]
MQSNLIPKVLKGANKNTTVLYSDLYPNKRGFLAKPFNKGELVSCWFRDVGFVTLNQADVKAYKYKGEHEAVKGDESNKVHGTGAAGNRLANFLRSKKEKKVSAKTAAGEKSNYADPLPAVSKSARQATTRILMNDKLSETEKHLRLRAKVVGIKSVSDKKGAKVRVNANQVQHLPEGME